MVRVFCCVFRAACLATNMNARPVLHPQRIRPSKSEVMVLQSSPEKAERLLGWKAQVSLEEGLRRSVEWMRGELGKYRAGDYVV